MTQIHVLCAVFVEFGRSEINEVVCYLLDKNTKFCLALASARIAPKICQGQRQTVYSRVRQISSKLFTFGGVIAELVNTVEIRDKVNPILG